MAPNGTIYPLTVSGEEFKMPSGPIKAMQLRVQGSLVAPRHGIRAIKEFPMIEGITECLERLEKGKMRHRGVLVAQ